MENITNLFIKSINSNAKQVRAIFTKAGGFNVFISAPYTNAIIKEFIKEQEKANGLTLAGIIDGVSKIDEIKESGRNFVIACENEKQQKEILKKLTAGQL